MVIFLPLTILPFLSATYFLPSAALNALFTLSAPDLVAYTVLPDAVLTKPVVAMAPEAFA
jgi:hypothetical protein